MAGFQGVDLTWVSSQQGWALGIAPGCSGQRCATILETTDGGQSWTTVADLHACLLEAAPVGCPAGVLRVSHIRFANADVGYAFSGEGGPFSMTTNGGLSWSVQSGRQAAEVEISSGTAVRLSFSRSGCPGPCDWSIDSSPSGGSRWSTLLTLPSYVNHGRVVLMKQGPSDVYAAFLGGASAGSASQLAQLYVSSDGGLHWSARPDPCVSSGGEGYVASNFNSAPDGVLVALCVARQGGSGQAVAVSSDAGMSFGPPRPLAVTGQGHFSEIAALSASDLFVASPNAELARSSDGGLQWRVELAPKREAGPEVPSATFLGFENGTVGRWIGPPDTLWTTSDGGVSWTATNF